MKLASGRQKICASKHGGTFRPRQIAAVMLPAFAALVTVHPASANTIEVADVGTPVEFDPTFLQSDSARPTDVSRFARGNPVSPGVYLVDVWMNGTHVARRDVRFVVSPGGISARPCLTRKMLEEAGVEFAKVLAGAGAGAAAEKAQKRDTAVSGADTGSDKESDAAAQAPLRPEECVDLSALVPDSSIEFDFVELKLMLSVPQIYMHNSARGYVPPEMWQDGVTAGFFSYTANTYRTFGPGIDTTQSYLGLNAGVNIGSWHFRHQSSVTQGTGRGTHFDNIATFVERDIPALKSEVTLGDGYTTGDVFDSVQFRGAQLATDDRMLPDSLRGYAPIVRGTADTNARVTIRQNGQVIDETSVSPGPFEINDLYPTGYGGNLDVTITEADGRTKSFSVPYAAVSQSLRPGLTRFSVTAGELRNESFQTSPYFAQFTYQRGLTNLFTGYGGGIVATGYVSGALGVALNTKYGAVSADVTVAQTEVPQQGSMHGTSLRIGYSKFIDATNTDITVAAYRYSTQGFLSLYDAATMRNLSAQGGNVDSLYRRRSNLQITLSQDFQSYGSIFLTVSSQQYWNRDGTEMFYQAGYTNTFRYGSYSLTAGRTRNSNGSTNNQYMASVTIPLGRRTHSPLLSANVSTGSGDTQLQTTVSGSLGDDNQYSYSAYGTYLDGGASNTLNGGASVAYRSPFAQLNASASAGRGTSQVSAGISGSVVAHRDGVLFSQTVGDTFGIVEAPGAAGANVINAPGVKLNSDGHAVVPYMLPFQTNTIDIDPKGTSTDIEFESTSERAVPRLGAIVLLKYKMLSGRAALIRAPQLGDKALPFGVDVLDASGRVVGVVAQDSRIFARGLQDTGSLFVKWGGAATETCRIDYALPASTGKPDAAYLTVDSHCVSDGQPASGNAPYISAISVDKK